MYTTYRNGVNPNRPAVDINGERYWSAKIYTKWVNLHEEEPTVRTFVKETMAMENTNESKKVLENTTELMISYCSD